MATQRFGRSCAAVGMVAMLSVWWALSAPAAHAAIEVTVTPATGLIDFQQVQVEVSGVPPESGFGACQTISGADEQSDCASGTVQYGEPSGMGTVSRTFAVRRFAYIPSLGRTVDCADPAERCTISAADPFDIVATLGEQPIAFAPPPPPPATRGSIAVSPADGLVDGDVVTVSGDGFRPDVEVVVEQCIDEPSTPNDCIQSLRMEARTDATGSFSTTLEVSRLFYPIWGGSRVDCVTSSCSVAVSERLDFPSTVVIAPLGFEVPREPAISVTPDQDLRPGDVVTVSGVNFVANEVVRAGPCDSNAQCGERTETVVAEDGSFAMGVIVSDPRGDCRRGISSCSVVVYQPGLLPITLLAPITFAPPPILLPGGATVVEGDGATTELHVPVTLSEPSKETVTVSWRTIYDPTWSHLAAVPGLDHSAASGVLAFAPGSNEATATILVNGDDVAEADELLVVSFRHPANARMGGFWGLGFGRITDDD